MISLDADWWRTPSYKKKFKVLLPIYFGLEAPSFTPQSSKTIFHLYLEPRTRLFLAASFAFFTSACKTRSRCMT